MRETPADEHYLHYLEARDAVMAAVRDLDPKRRKFRTPDGIFFRIDRKPPLRLLLLGVGRYLPDETGYTSFSFQRNGRVSLGGNRKIPLRQAIAGGHEPWASRGELLELAGQIRAAEPA